ncbi:MAG: peptidylprolyl isomerase [Planctomycetes bacterium]|nr:peptidylprolyl isomerase [Planctomycetota bacterium]
MKQSALLLAAIVLAGGVPACDVNVQPPVPGQGLTVDAGEDQFTFDDETVTLQAVASEGVPPYVFRWSIQVVPDDDQIGRIVNETSPEIETLPFVVGHYVYRVRVTDADGASAVDYVAMEVSPEPLRIEIDGPEEEETVELFEAVPLRASTNLEGDFEFKWSVASGDAEFDNDEAERVRVTPLSIGEIILRVTAKDDEQDLFTSENFTLNVEQGSGFRVALEKPDLLLVDEPATLVANITNDTIDEEVLSYEWEVVRGSAELSAADTKTVQVTGTIAQTVVVKVTVRGEIEGSAKLAQEEVSLIVVDDLRTQVIMTVRSDAPGVSGDITFELFGDVAPKTVANLLLYIDERFYNGIVWHRVAETEDGDPFVIQCGGFTRSGDVLQSKEPTRDPIPSEADPDFSNLPGTIAMALKSGDADSGDTQFFVNMKDNSFLDDQGFTVFGKVLEGQDIVDAIAVVDRDVADGESEDGNEFTLSDVPVDDITISTFRRVGGPGGFTFGDDDGTIITGGDDEDSDDQGDGKETGDDSGDENPDDDGSVPPGGGGASFGG